MWLPASYLCRLIQDRQHSHNLQSTTTTLCQLSTTTTFVKHAYWCSAPAVWNSLTKTVVNSDSVTEFKFGLDIPSLPGFLSSFLSVAHCLAPSPLKLMVLYKYIIIIIHSWRTSWLKTTALYCLHPKLLFIVCCTAFSIHICLFTGGAILSGIESRRSPQFCNWMVLLVTSFQSQMVFERCCIVAGWLKVLSGT